MDDEQQACDNCKRLFGPTLLEWIGYAYYCPDCWAAYWDGSDASLKALRCGWIDSYTSWAESEAEPGSST